MPTDLATFDPRSIQDKITDRIRASFVELIPEEHWQAMVKREIDWFTAELPDNYGYTTTQKKPSPLRLLIQGRLEEMFKDKLAMELAKPEYQHIWNSNQALPGEAVKKIIHESLPRLAEVAFGNVIQNAIERLR